MSGHNKNGNTAGTDFRQEEQDDEVTILTLTESEPQQQQQHSNPPYGQQQRPVGGNTLDTLLGPDSDEDEKPTAQHQQQPQMCLRCQAKPIEYMSSVCRHPLYCKSCAMKCATGGKCKICGTLFPDLRRL